MRKRGRPTLPAEKRRKRIDICLSRGSITLVDMLRQALFNNRISRSKLIELTVYLFTAQFLTSIEKVMGESELLHEAFKKYPLAQQFCYQRIKEQFDLVETEIRKILRSER